MKSQSLQFRPVQAVRLGNKPNTGSKIVAYAIYVALVVVVIVLAVRSFDQPVGSQHQSISDIIAHQSDRLEAAMDAATK